MSKTLVTALVLVFLLVWGSSLVGSDIDKSISTLSKEVYLEPPALSKSAACAMQKHNDTAAGFFSGFVLGDRIITYFDPTAECGSPAYPFELQAISFTLYDPGGYQWPVDVDIIVYDLLGADSCGGPGNELCRFSVLVDSSTFAFPTVGTVSFPVPCCLTGPAYIGFEYTDTGGGTFPSILFDNSALVPTCENWVFGLGEWFEWYDFWAAPEPGYPIFWVFGETESGACAGQVVINELIYSPGEVGRLFDLHEHEWVEIYNAGNASIDLTGWTISNRDGNDNISLPSWDLPPGCFLKLHQGSGTNDSDFDDLDGHYYTGSPVEIFDDDEDECALYDGAPGATTIVDFVSWSNKGSYSPGTAHGFAAGSGIWTSGDYFNSDSLVNADCLARYFDGYDRNLPNDWRRISWTLYAQNRSLQPENPIQESPRNRAVINDATPTFDWSDFPDADGYQLQVDNDWDFSSPEIDVSGLAASDYTPASPLSDDAYFWRVRATESGSPTPWAAEWLFVVSTVKTLGGAAEQLSCPHKYQRKDTQLLCLWEQRASTRPGCVETGNHAWDVPHPNAAPPGCPHDDNYCARASVAMVNAKYGGDLSQDRISYRIGQNYRAQPEGDLGHNVGWSDGQVTTALSWALNGAAINYQFVGAGNFTFAQIQGWINQLDCFVAAVPGHCLVIDGYALSSATSGNIIQIVYSQDPWRGPNNPSVFSYVISGAPEQYWRRHRNNSFDAVWLQPAAGVTSRMQEAAVITDSDGDGIMDFDEQNPRVLHSVHNDTDTDDDQVDDKPEIRNYTFHDQAGYHPGHENDALNFPDLDNDGLRAENDCDSDNDSDFDGGEDIDGDAHNPVPNVGNVCNRETCQFDAAEFCIKVAVDKDTYLLGEPVYIVDQHYTRETHTYHENSTYNYEKGAGCPTKADGSPLAHNGSFNTDGGGHAIRKLVEYCLSPGDKYLTVDVLDDNLYSTPDNLDPQTCWTCAEDWFHGFHWGYDYPFHNPDANYPGYDYPGTYTEPAGDPSYVTYTIVCPWWWWCYEWPPVFDDYWLGVGLPADLVESGDIRFVETRPPLLVEPTENDSGAVHNAYIPTEIVQMDLTSSFPLPNVQWFGFEIPDWQLPDSQVATRIQIEVRVSDKLAAASPTVIIMAGDAVFGWSPTPYDSIPITVLSGGCCIGNRGDLNGDDIDANILDLTFLVDFIFRGGAPAGCPEEADLNNDGTPANILDLTFLVDFIFRGGPPPGPC